MYRVLPKLGCVIYVRLDKLVGAAVGKAHAPVVDFERLHASKRATQTIETQTNAHARVFRVVSRRGEEEEEDYDFDYSDEGEEDTDVDLENTYYAAKALKAEDPKAAVEAFREARSHNEWFLRMHIHRSDVVGWVGNRFFVFSRGYHSPSRGAHLCDERGPNPISFSRWMACNSVFAHFNPRTPPCAGDGTTRRSAVKSEARATADGVP